MPDYEFEDEKGRVVMIYYPMEQAPAVGAVLEEIETGRKLRRIYSLVSIGGQAGKPDGGSRYCFKDMQARRWDPRFKHHLPDGTPYCDSKRDLDEVLAHDEQLVWDPGLNEMSEHEIVDQFDKPKNEHLESLKNKKPSESEMRAFAQQFRIVEQRVQERKKRAS